MRVNQSDTCSTAGECITYNNVINWLNQYNYVHIDEISISNNHPSPECASVIRCCARLSQWNSAFASYYPGSNLYMAADQCSSNMSSLTTFFS